MSVVRLDDDDLDDEDRAILAEVAKKGYYHGRPKSVACPPPVRIAEPTVVETASAGTNIVGRVQFDEFQRKWDRFDCDEYLDNLEAKLAGAQAKPAKENQQVSQLPLGMSGAGARRRPSVEFKLLLAGDSAVGKTALMRRHLTGEFTARWTATQGPTMNSLTFTTNCGEIDFNVWDLASAGKHFVDGCIRETFYAQGQCAIIMFDVTSRNTYRSVPGWYREIVRICGSIPIVLVANKVDSQTKQLKLQTILFHRKKNLQFYPLSVRRLTNFEKPFLWLARRLTNQPELRFLCPVAVEPEALLDPVVFAEHERRLAAVQQVAVGDDDE